MKSRAHQYISAIYDHAWMDVAPVAFNGIILPFSSHAKRLATLLLLADSDEGSLELIIDA